MKYVIDIDHVPYLHMDEKNNMSPPLYKAKGFNSLVFDQNGLDKLEKYNCFDALEIELNARRKGYDSGYDNGYDDGLKDAWELAKKVVYDTTFAQFTKMGILGMFDGGEDCANILKKYSYNELKEKFEEYDKKKEFKVGDGIINKTSHDKAIIVGTEDGLYVCMSNDGISSLSKFELNEMWEKTGVTYPEAPKLFVSVRTGLGDAKPLGF